MGKSKKLLALLGVLILCLSLFAALTITLIPDTDHPMPPRHHPDPYKAQEEREVPGRDVPEVQPHGAPEESNGGWLMHKIEEIETAGLNKIHHLQDSWQKALPHEDAYVPQGDEIPHINEGTVVVTFPDNSKHEILFSTRQDTGQLKETFQAEGGLAPDTEFGLVDKEGRGIAVSATLLQDKEEYTLVVFDAPATSLVNHARKHHSSQRVHGKLPKVIICCIATGRYREFGLTAIHSAVERFGGDCLPTFYFLSDNTDGIEAPIKTKKIPYREWPYSGLRKFEDMLTQLGDEMDTHDYFYFIDADTKFEENVALGDISGDLVGVEHPMYPRNDPGFCLKDDRLCQFPYDHNIKSQAYIPRQFKKMEPDYRWANWYYLQSALWGGKTKFVKPALIELTHKVEVDIKKKIISQSIQDERYVNWYFWFHRDDKNMNLRILSHSYLFPGPRAAAGFGEWLHNRTRPIIRHVDKVSYGHLPVGEIEIESLEKKGQCLDIYPPKSHVGIFGCHHLGDTQGWHFQDANKQLRSQGRHHQCMDTANLKPGDAIVTTKCDTDKATQKWQYDKNTMHFENPVSGLCLDSTAYHKEQMRIGVSKCNPSNMGQKFKTTEKTGV